MVDSFDKVQPPEENKRHEYWELFGQLAAMAELPAVEKLESFGFPEELIHFAKKNTAGYNQARSRMLDAGSLEEAKQKNDRKYKNLFKKLVDKARSGSAEKMPAGKMVGGETVIVPVRVSGKKYALRMYRGYDSVGAFRDFLYFTRAMQMASGIDSVRQLMCYSFADGVQVVEYMPGKDLIEKGQVSSFDDQSITQLLTTIGSLNRKGLAFDDISGTNLLFDPDTNRFSILEYSVGRQTLSEILPALAGCLVGMRILEKKDVRKTALYKQLLQRLTKIVSGLKEK